MTPRRINTPYDVSGQFTIVQGATPRFADYYSEATLFNYDQEDLAFEFTEAAPEGIAKNLTPAQQSLLRKDIPCIANSSTTLLLLHEYFHILDQAFFFGLLRPHLTIALLPYQPEVDIFGEPWHKAKLGYYRRYWEGEWSPSNAGRPVIQIAPQPPEGVHSMLQYVPVLAHEMIHAFLDLFSRIDSNGTYTMVDNIANHGETGHGAAWCDIATAMQRALQDFYGFQVDFLIRNCLLQEMAVSGQQPTEEQFERWGMPSFTFEDAKKWCVEKQREFDTLGPNILPPTMMFMPGRGRE